MIDLTITDTQDLIPFCTLDKGTVFMSVSSKQVYIKVDSDAAYELCNGRYLSRVTTDLLCVVVKTMEVSV